MTSAAPRRLERPITVTNLDLETDARKNLPQVNERRNPEGRMPRPDARASSAISSAVGTRASAISVHMAHTSQQLSKNSPVKAKSG